MEKLFLIAGLLIAFIIGWALGYYTFNFIPWVKYIFRNRKYDFHSVASISYDISNDEIVEQKQHIQKISKCIGDIIEKNRHEKIQEESDNSCKMLEKVRCGEITLEEYLKYYNHNYKP